MIESRLDPATDGTGGGYGNYPGLTVEQIADRFRHLAEEGHPRSVRAILRIVHEQTSARGGLGTQRYLVGIALAATLVLIAARFLAPEAMREKVTIYLIVSVVVTALFFAGAASLHRTTLRAEAQVREIRRLALLALERVVEAEGFAGKPLEREHLRSLDGLRSVDRESWRRVNARLRQV